ncbi:alpha/beta hydrolase [Devosia sp. A8/3-2]|nr:alpha/beta hydrolase [Devosia sp. A8/3-2]
MSTTTLIVPGLHGSEGEHWQAHWRRDHPGAILVEQSDWSNPQADRWLSALEAAVIAHPQALIVAHSPGSVLTARLARSKVASLVTGALLVAPADINCTAGLHKRSYEFGNMPQDVLPFPCARGGEPG